MKSLLSVMKVFDFLIIIGIILLSFLPLLMTGKNWLDQQPSGPFQAVVTIKGQVAGHFLLTPEAGHLEQTFRPNAHQYNIIEQEGNRIRVKEDNSPDQIAVNTGWLSRPGQVAICLPHQLILEIKGPVSADEMILPFPQAEESVPVESTLSTFE